MQPCRHGLPNPAHDEMREHGQIALIVAAEPVVEMLSEQ
ncbi:Uncharacterised protein [Mycobacteroides abscessus subsp. abscessus]|nr:Uncharacterised protein [Mycobacteroides abscessus subsp. abscessus]